MVKRQNKNRIARNPKIFGSRSIRERKSLNINFKLVKYVFFGVLVLFLLVVLFFSPLFRVKDIIIEGSDLLSNDDVRKEIPQNKNIFLIKSNEIEAKLISRFPEIKSVEIYRGIPNALKVVILERDGRMIWQSGEQKYLISSQGEVSKKINEGEFTDLPIIIDKKSLPVKPGEKLVSANFVAFVNNINNSFFNTVNIKPVSFDIDETTFDVNLLTDAGIYIKFNSLRSSKKQLDNLKLVLDQKRQDIHEYIDLRIDGWAYYK